MGVLDWFRPSPRMIAARWIAESMRREPQEWKEISPRTYRRGDVVVFDYHGTYERLWIEVDGQRWRGMPGRIIANALDNRHALMTAIRLADAHA